jgi:hypothetical protein
MPQALLCSSSSNSSSSNSNTNVLTVNDRGVNMPALLVSGHITGGALLIWARAGKSDGQAATQKCWASYLILTTGPCLAAAAAAAGRQGGRNMLPTKVSNVHSNIKHHHHLKHTHC